MLPAETAFVIPKIVRHAPISLAVWHVNSPTNKRIALADNGERLDKTILRVCPGNVEVVHTTDIVATVDSLTSHDFITAGVPHVSDAVHDAKYTQTNVITITSVLTENLGRHRFALTSWELIVMD